MGIQTRVDHIETNDRSALICVDEPLLQTTVIEQISQMGFGIHTALYAEEVAVKLRSRVYDLVVIGETFAGASAETNSALTEMANLPLEQRRKSFVILIGPVLVSRSEMQSFMFSVDLTLNDDDAPNLKTIAGLGTSLKAEFYTSFNNALKALRRS
jgi:hypothetical protein